MCTLSVISLGDSAGYRVVINRDEERTRPAAIAPMWREVDGVRAIWPTDPVGGGTWVAASERGVVLAILNRNLEPRPVLPPGLRSRGTIIPECIAASGRDDYLRRISKLDVAAFAPFRLVACLPTVSEDGCEVIETIWDRRGLVIRPCVAPPMCYVSSGLGDSIAADRTVLFKQTVALGNMSAFEQDAFHEHAWPGRGAESVMMSRADARTISVTTIDVPRLELGWTPTMTYRSIG